MVVSRDGHGLFDPVTGEKIDRDRDPDPDEDTPDASPDLSCPGVGPVTGSRVRIARLFGGGFHTVTGDSWILEVVTPAWPNDRVLLSRDGGLPHSDTRESTRAAIHAQILSGVPALDRLTDLQVLDDDAFERQLMSELARRELWTLRRPWVTAGPLPRASGTGLAERGVSVDGAFSCRSPLGARPSPGAGGPVPARRGACRGRGPASAADPRPSRQSSVRSTGRQLVKMRYFQVPYVVEFTLSPDFVSTYDDRIRKRTPVGGVPVSSSVSLPPEPSTRYSECVVRQAPW